MAYLLLILLLITSYNSYAEAPHHSVPINQVIDIAHDNGIAKIDTIKYNNNEYSVSGIADDDLYSTIVLNASNGLLLSDPLNSQPIISMTQAIQAVEKAGYSDIFGIKMTKDHYEIDAIDPKNHEAQVDVDYFTGKVGHEWW